MANYKGHLVGGFALYALTLYVFSLYYYVSPIQAGQWLLFSLAGALFPDVDTKSKGQYYFYWIVFIATIYLTFIGKWYLAALISIVAFTPLLVRHRGIFHNVWFIMGITAIISISLSYYVPAYSYALYMNGAFFCLGAFSHLVLDFGLFRTLGR